jgi:hypothetical protein
MKDIRETKVENWQNPIHEHARIESNLDDRQGFFTHWQDRERIGPKV